WSVTGVQTCALPICDGLREGDYGAGVHAQGTAGAGSACDCAGRGGRVEGTRGKRESTDGVRRLVFQLSAISYQLSALDDQLLDISGQKGLRGGVGECGGGCG